MKIVNLFALRTVSELKHRKLLLRKLTPHHFLPICTLLISSESHSVSQARLLKMAVYAAFAICIIIYVQSIFSIHFAAIECWLGKSTFSV